MAFWGKKRLTLRNKSDLKWSLFPLPAFRQDFFLNRKTVILKYL